MRAILINPYNQTVSEIDTSGECGGPTGLYATLKAADPLHSDMVEIIRVGDEVDLWVDEESNLSDGRPIFQMQDGPFVAGAAILLCHNTNGDTTPLAAYVTLDKVKATVIWTDLLTTGELTPGTAEDIDHPVFGKTRMINTGTPIYREAAGYMVWCMLGEGEDSHNPEPHFVPATSNVFVTRGDALAYAKTVASSRNPEVREAH